MKTRYGAILKEGEKKKSARRDKARSYLRGDREVRLFVPDRLRHREKTVVGKEKRNKK